MKLLFQQLLSTILRPGTDLPFEGASTARVEADPALLSEFIIKALGFGADDPVFISDESCLRDFGDEEIVDGIRGNIQEHFGLTLDQTEPVLLADVLEAIRQRREDGMADQSP
jgi:hypothetical protein